MKASRDTVVRIHYTLTDDEGKVLDSSRGGKPLAYLHGHGSIVRGLERALDGADVGHKAKVSVAPPDAYGERDPDAVFLAERKQFPKSIKLAAGTQVHAETPDGPMSFTILEVRPDACLLDGNHPLAGKTLHFDVEVLEVRQATHDELAHGHAH